MIKNRPFVICLIGPAGSGKTACLYKLLKAYPDKLVNSVSVTTRAPRSYEDNGKTREFVSREEFQKLIDTNALFEYEETHGNLYGTRRSTIDNAFAKGQNILFDIEIRGSLSLKKTYPKQTVICQIGVESKDVLVERIKSRSEVSEEEIAARLRTADQEFALYQKHADSIDYFILNKDLNLTVEVLKKIIDAESHRMSRIDFGD